MTCRGSSRWRLTLWGAASRFFDDGDGVPQDGVDVEIGRIENVSVRRRLERRNCAFGIAFVPTPDIPEDRGLVCSQAQAAHLERATLRPYLGRSGHENLGFRERTDDGPDVAAVQDGARRDGGKILLQLQQRRSHLRNSRDHGGGLAGCVALERGFVELGRIEGLRCGDRARDIIERVAGVKHRLGHRPVEQPGIEMTQPVMGGETLAERSLAGGGRTVDGDNHSRSPPSPRMRSAKPGKLVAMKAASSTVTGLSAARPSTSAAMAMRWSMWVATRPPPSAWPRPCTARSSPEISTSTPLMRSISAVAARRSDSLTRSSFRPRITVAPSANAAATARTGYSSIMAGARCGGTSTPRNALCRTRNPAIVSPPSCRTSSSTIAAPISRRVVISPVRNGLVMTSGRSMSEPGTSSAATIGKAADDGSAGTATFLGASSGWPTSEILRP